MKFELVEFYPVKKSKHKNMVGTVHIYAIDCELDIRGIAVNWNGKSMFFYLPHYKAVDSETGDLVSYPHIRWTNEATHKEMMNFLHQEVRPEIMKRLNIKKSESGGSDAKRED